MTWACAGPPFQGPPILSCPRAAGRLNSSAALGTGPGTDLSEQGGLGAPP